MSPAPKPEVRIKEVGPREGFQAYPQIISSKQKLKLISLLAQTGVPEIEVTSFVRPDRVPQLADAAEIATKLSTLPKTGTEFSALYLNAKGLEGALKFSSLRQSGTIHVATSSEFLLSNTSKDLENADKPIFLLLETFSKNEIVFETLVISTAFEGIAISKLLSKLLPTLGSITPQYVVLADTSGVASPQKLRDRLADLRSFWPLVTPVLHLHDSIGLGLATAYEGLRLGIRDFEASVAGVGGCPFHSSTTGNIATEELVLLAESEGFSTGICLDSYYEAASYVTKLLSIPGSKLFRSRVKEERACKNSSNKNDLSEETKGISRDE